jgi:AcrR family transcriptional regulator
MQHNRFKEKSDETTRRILDTAAKIFSEVGFDGARMDEIAKRAEVNKATIYYHIGGKEMLYARVLHEHFDHAADRIEGSLKGIHYPEDKLKLYIRHIARTLDENPHRAAIMMREVASGGQSFPEAVAQDIANILKMLTDILEEGHKKGVFIKANPFNIHMMVIGALLFYRAAKPIRLKLARYYEPIKKIEHPVSGLFVDEIEKLIVKALKS